MNTAAAVAATPATAVCALPMLGFALRHLEAMHAGQPLPQSPETEGLPTDVAGLIAFCIRRANDAAFMMTINPDRVRANGNEEGAAFLQAKLTEWADALHDYETFGSAHNPRHADARLALQRTNSLLKAMRQRSATKHPTDKLLLDATIRRLAIEAGIDAPEIALQPESSTGDLLAGQ